MKTLHWTALLLVLFHSALRTFGHDVPVHKAITDNAVQSAEEGSPEFNSFLSLIATDSYVPSQALLSMVSGSAHEDDPETKFSPQDAGKFRSFNHFYDPLETQYGKGLSDVPAGRIQQGEWSLEIGRLLRTEPHNI